MRFIITIFIFSNLISGCHNNQIKGIPDSRRIVYIDSTYIAEDNEGSNIKGFKTFKSYTKDSLIYTLRDFANIDSFNMWRYSSLNSLFTDTCRISSKSRIVGFLGLSEIQEILFTIDSCLNPNTLYKCYSGKCNQFLCVVIKLANSTYRPLIFNHLRFDEYPDSVRIYEVNNKSLISVYSSISGNTGETKEFYFIEDNDTIKL